MISFSPHQLEDQYISLLLLIKTVSLVAPYRDGQCLTDNRTDTSTNLSPMPRHTWLMHNIAADPLGVPQ